MTISTSSVSLGTETELSDPARSSTLNSTPNMGLALNTLCRPSISVKTSFSFSAGSTRKPRMYPPLLCVVWTTSALPNLLSLTLTLFICM